ncbi:hypothetical protein [Sphingomonas sp. UYEF23]|uniref:hypothetical protein n=1 Tax=Sphingomonas sp. UYEF23 TaxID=1756408 RepID=UPI00339AB6CE
MLDFDDYPFHQTSATFDQAGTSDLRFFDRYWFSVRDPQNRFGLIAGLGVYKNMDVSDGFVSLAHGGKQTNLRVSRRLRPDWLPLGAGPLRMEIVAPMRQHRLTLATNEQRIACDLTLDATSPLFGEAQYLTRDRGWLEKDYQRLFQLARATGWVEIDGERFDSGPDGWPTARDRSFGVRPGVGGPSAGRGQAMASGIGAHEALAIGTLFETPDHYGHLHLSENAAGEQIFMAGTIYDRAGGKVRVRSITHELGFGPGGRDFQGGTYVLADDADGTWQIEVRPTARFVYQGFGYMDGWSDRQGLGAWRGGLAVEGETYDLRDLANIVDQSGRHTFAGPGMMHAQLDVTLNGAPGHGEGIAVLLPQHDRYGEGRV